MALSTTIRKFVEDKSKALVSTGSTARKTNLSLLDHEFAAGETLRVGIQSVVLSRPSVLVFHDLEPQKNWAHACEYLLFDANTGDHYQTLPSNLPPPDFAVRETKVRAFHSPVKMQEIHLRRGPVTAAAPGVVNAMPTATGERYAVLFSGHSNNRHVNDMEFLYRTLIDVYGFLAANITVLNHDGTVNYYGGPKPVGNWPGDNTAYRMPVDGEGTRAEFQTAISDIAAVIGPEDLLLIHTNNHGGSTNANCGTRHCHNTDYCMFVYDAAGSWVEYTVTDFVADLDPLPEIEVLCVMMEQCHSGGFIQPIIDASSAKWTHVAAAVPASDHSDGGADFDPFAEDWIAGITGSHADGGALTQVVDTDTDSRVSASEAFVYTNANPSGGDTPTSDESPAGCGDNIWLGMPAHDLFLRDNLQDHGREPLIGGGISCSPDIIIFNQELLDPDATLLNPTAQTKDTLGDPVEKGQDNFVYLRVQNRGTESTAGTATVYWCQPSILPTPASWHKLGDVNIPSVPSNQMSVVGPITWLGTDIPNTGHYCFVALIQSGDDPGPDLGSIVTVTDFYNLIRSNNNATWKNFDVVNVFKDAITNFAFHIQGWTGKRIKSDLEIDLSELPLDVEVRLRIIKRLSGPAEKFNMNVIDQTRLYQKLQVEVGGKAYLKDMRLRASDDTQASLEFVIPEGIQDGAYRISVSQRVDEQELGRVTRVIAVGEHPFLGNRNSRELHVASCSWAHATGRRNRVAYQTVERALKHGYNGCYYCLREFNTD